MQKSNAPIPSRLERIGRRFRAVGLLILTVSPLTGQGVELGSRQQTIQPRDIPPDAPQIGSSNVAEYVSSGYGVWDWAPGTNQGVRLDLMAPGYVATSHVARLLSFFSISDVHITDKESPAQVPFVGWEAGWHNSGMGGLNQQSYSPVMFSTHQVLDAAIRTINALEQVTPFDFGICLGDICNSGQHNELRWFIDIMDGKWIRPSSGAHMGEDTIDYQKPFQAAGLSPAIPWYEVIGNHDQFWMGIGYPTAKILAGMIGSNVLNISSGSPLYPNASEGTGEFTGVVNGNDPFGGVIDSGPTNLYSTPPTVAADSNRYMFTTDLGTPVNFTREFTNSTSLPPGHGFAPDATGELAACYSFLPLTNLPLKVIVLDDTCKSNLMGQGATFYGAGWVDQARLTWLTNEIQAGQDADQLMILACHIPIYPQADVYTPGSYSTSFATAAGNIFETNLISILHNYPNLLMVMAGHRHVNTVTACPSPDPLHPENGFWEVETPSLRDFAQQFRTWEIFRNSDNSISILTTDVDPTVQTNTPAWKSRAYAVGAVRIYNIITNSGASSGTYNVELVKQLTPAMQSKISGYGRPLGHCVAINGSSPGGPAVSFLGRLETKHDLHGLTWDAVPGATNSPYPVAAISSQRFYRAVEP